MRDNFSHVVENGFVCPHRIGSPQTAKMSTDKQPENVPETIVEDDDEYTTDEEEEEDLGPCVQCGWRRMGFYTEYCVDCFWDERDARKHNCSPVFTSNPREPPEQTKSD